MAKAPTQRDVSRILSLALKGLGEARASQDWDVAMMYMIIVDVARQLNARQALSPLSPSGHKEKEKA